MRVLSSARYTGAASLWNFWAFSYLELVLTSGEIASRDRQRGGQEDFLPILHLHDQSSHIVGFCDVCAGSEGAARAGLGAVGAAPDPVSEFRARLGWPR